jgi:hypothetical protein
VLTARRWLDKPWQLYIAALFLTSPKAVVVILRLGAQEVRVFYKQHGI